MGCGSSKNNKTDAAIPEKKEPETQPGNEKQEDEEKPNDQKQQKQQDQNQEVDEAEQEQINGEIVFDDDEAVRRQMAAQQAAQEAAMREQQMQALERAKAEKGNLSDLSDLPLYRQENPNFQFHEGELSPITTPTGGPRKKKGQQDVQEVKPMPKKVVVKRQRLTPFNWGNEGRVEIKSISYKIKYNFLLKSFKTIKSKDDYQTTILSWIKNDEEDIFEFTLKDTFLTNLRTGIDTPLQSPALEFHVDPDGKFIKISNIEEFADKLLDIQGKKEVMTKKQRKRFKKMLDLDFHKSWNYFVENWLHINKPENEEMILDKYPQYGTNVFVASKLNLRDEDEIKENLKKKLLNERSYYKMMGSKNMVRDKFKKWKLHEDTSKKESKLVGEEEKDMHRNIRLNFFLTSKYDSSTALIDPKTIRPFITNSESSRKIVFDVNRDLYIDVEYEAKQNLFMWDETAQEMNMDDYLVDEMVKFQDMCDEALQDMIEELSEIKRVPLIIRFEKPKLEDEKLVDEDPNEYQLQQEMKQQYQYDENVNDMSQRNGLNGQQIGQNKGDYYDPQADE